MEQFCRPCEQIFISRALLDYLLDLLMYGLTRSLVIIDPQQMCRANTAMLQSLASEDKLQVAPVNA